MSLTDPATIARNRAELHGEIPHEPVGFAVLLLCLIAPWLVIGFLCWSLWPAKANTVHRVENTFHP